MQGFMTTKELSQFLSVSTTYIGDRRNKGDWKERIHWIYLNPNCKQAGIRFIPELCLNWIYNQSHPDQHNAFIADFLSRHQLTA